MSNGHDEQDPDAALLEQARSGADAAFVRLAIRWWIPLHRVSWNMSGNPARAAEVAETVSFGLRSPADLPPSGVPLRTFLFRRVMGLLLRADSRRQPAKRSRDTIGTLRDGLAHLDELDRAAFVLCDIEQLPVGEAASVLARTSQEIRIRICRARSVLAIFRAPQAFF